MYQHHWSKKEIDTMGLGHSVASEPEATIRLTKRAMDRFGEDSTIVYVSDHKPFVDAVAHGSSMKPEYNARVTRFRNLQPRGQLRYEEGAKNLADKYSRFILRKLTPEHEAAAVSLAERVLAERNTGRTPCVVEQASAAREGSPSAAKARHGPSLSEAHGGGVQTSRRGPVWASTA